MEINNMEDLKSVLKKMQEENDLLKEEISNLKPVESEKEETGEETPEDKTEEKPEENEEEISEIEKVLFSS